MGFAYGWKRGPKVEAQKFEAPHFAVGLPTSVDLTPLMPPVYDQGNLGSCTSNAGAGLAQFLTRKLGWKDYLPSRLAIYYWERVLEGTTDWDSGATLTDCMNVLNHKGAPNDTLWMYDINNYTVAPTQNVIDNGLMHLVTDPVQVRQNLNDMQACLASGYPFIFGFTVYQSFESSSFAKTGIMPMPKRNEQIIGGHAVLCCGYDNKTKMMKCRNSWGTAWGQKRIFLDA